MPMRGFGVCSVLLVLLLAAWRLPAAGEPSKIQSTPYLAGQLLVAHPDMRDIRFQRSVVYIVDHDANGAMGLIVNKKIGSGPVADLLRGFGLEPNEAKGTIDLHYGGPVNGSRGFALFAGDYRTADSRSADGHIYFTADVAILKALAAGAGPKQLLFVVGRAVWQPGQLEREMEHGFWTTAPASDELVFGTGPVDAWERASGAGGLPL